MEPSAVTVPELPEVNVGGGGEFELFFDANVEPEKRMAYIVSASWPLHMYFELLSVHRLKHCSIFFLFFKVDDGFRLHARF